MEQTIFIVEDDEAILSSLKGQLEQWSFQGRSPESFQDIITSFTKSDPHLVFMDIQLPAYDVRFTGGVGN
ncbi:response regulator [Sporosarcina gallistercoris]|uniref:response regulator n=1 Tax=Sporosarcina gallistercoris TaxID=2762245 RepID=UPI003D28134A